MFEHTCLKCHRKYEDKDPDPYFCEDCKRTKMQIAAEIDARLANREHKEVQTPLQQYDAVAKMRGTRFISAKDMGFL